MSFSHRSSPESAPSATLHEAIMDSVSSVRDSLPEQHRAHFETLRQEIIDFAQVHGIPKESLTKPDLLREATCKLSTQDLERLADLLERFEHLVKYKEPKKEDYTEALEHAERLYHLREQYTSQVSLLEQVGILKEGVILGIDGNTYPIPTLEQIAVRLFERRKELKTKHDQGFTKLLLVPFGMSLDALQEVLKQFLLSYKKSHPSFELNTDEPLWTWDEYQGADIGDSPKLVYYPESFVKKGHGGKTKREILEGWGDPTPTYVRDSLAHSSPGWTVHLLQPSDPSDPDSPGFAHIPREGQGTLHPSLREGRERPSLEAGKTLDEYLSLLQKAQDDPCSPYHGETGMTPEDWVIAFMTHLSQTGQPLDNVWNPTNISCFTGAFFPSSAFVSGTFWNHNFNQVYLCSNPPRDLSKNIGVRSSVVV